MYGDFFVSECAENSPHPPLIGRCSWCAPCLSLFPGPSGNIMNSTRLLSCQDRSRPSETMRSPPMLESPIALAARRIALLFLLITAAACPVRPGDAQEPRGPRLTQDQVKQLQEAQRHGQQAGKLLDEGKTGEAIRAWQKKLAIER